MQPKLADVAREAGVSPTTVSRVINNKAHLSEKTKNNVYAAMKKLNYQPNSLARSLHGKQTHLIGVIFPSVSNPFYAELIELIENKLFKNNYKIILCNSANNSDKERNYLRMLLANQVDGIIVGTHNVDIKEYQKVELPIVSFDRKLADNIPIVSSDNAAGGKMAAEELINHNAHDLYFVGRVHHANATNPTDLRQQAFQETITAHGLIPHTWNLSATDSVTIKRAKIEQLLHQPVDGIFAADDFTALLVMQTAKNLGIQLPEQLKLIGYDGTKFIQNYHPELSTIVQPIEDMADLLISILLERIDHKSEVSLTDFKLPNTLLRSQTLG